ncbi:hypothetical protein MPH_08529 [Macrophomina phaseolina MS6]|uniref:Uncharacterized protein n=1 Tax=Macrophomina phaseolina (strain MS6) TaxID=1126212 RepID=K2RI45_MACPH|nr:hypothetical protein MPH_08529 [Macrophomina phaseolina MS6]
MAKLVLAQLPEALALSMQEQDSSQVLPKRVRSMSRQALRGTRSTQASTRAFRKTEFWQRHSGVSLTQTSARAFRKHWSRQPPGEEGTLQVTPQVVVVAGALAVEEEEPPMLRAASTLARPRTLAPTLALRRGEAAELAMSMAAAKEPR